MAWAEEEDEYDPFEKPLGFYDEFEHWPEESCGPIYWLFKHEADREREWGGDADSVS